MESQTQRDLALGMTLGLAAGDALGRPFRGSHRHKIEMEQGLVREMEPGPNREYLAGQWGTEAGQMMAAMESYLACKGFDGEDVSLRLVEMTGNPDYHFDREGKEVLDRVAEEPENWDKAALQVWYEGGSIYCTNGALARTTVAALRHRNDMPRMIEDTIRLCRVTHYDPRCVEAALAINFLLQQCLHGRFHQDLLDQCIGFLENFRKQPDYRRMVLSFDESTLSQYQNMTPMLAFSEDRDVVIRELRLVRSLTFDDLGSNDIVVHTMQTAIWALFQTRSVEEGVARVVSLGGQADTQGALAGALLGARFGFQRIPVGWLKFLADRPRIISLTELFLAEN